MRLTSTDFDDGGQLDTRHGKMFDNVSPQLAWSDVPNGAGSLALTMIDSHPVARGFVHWFVDGIPPAAGELGTGAGGDLPMGRAITPYVGPFPPSGTHEYVITLYALDASAPAVPTTTKATDFADLVRGHVLDTATLAGNFTKPGS